MLALLLVAVFLAAGAFFVVVLALVFVAVFFAGALLAAAVLVAVFFAAGALVVVAFAAGFSAALPGAASFTGPEVPVGDGSVSKVMTTRRDIGRIVLD